MHHPPYPSQLSADEQHRHVIMPRPRRRFRAPVTLPSSGLRCHPPVPDPGIAYLGSSVSQASQRRHPGEVAHDHETTGSNRRGRYRVSSVIGCRTTQNVEASMTATSYRPATTDTPPRKRARILLWGFVAANLLTVEILFVTDGAGKHPLLTIAKFFGLHAALAMMLQLLLVARVPWLDRRIGMDRLTVWHRWLGFALLWTVVLHASFVVLGYATLYGNPLVGTFFDLAAVPASLLGVLGATIVVAIAAVSIRAIRRRLPYEWWHGIHLTLYLALVLALAHQFLEGTTFTSTTWSTLYWWGMWGLVLTALVAFRVLVPLWRNARHRFRVAAVVPESDHVASIYVTGRDLHRLPARAGQFCLWRFP